MKYADMTPEAKAEHDALRSALADAKAAKEELEASRRAERNERLKKVKKDATVADLRVAMQNLIDEVKELKQ